MSSHMKNYQEGGAGYDEIIKKTEFIKRYCEYDIQTACNIATGDDETTGKEVIRILKIITEEENSVNFRTQVKNN